MMTDTPFPALAEDYAAALDWWREAGVDSAYADEPQQWLHAPEVEQAPEPQPPPRTVPRQSATPALDRALARGPGAPIGGDRVNWPGDLAAFREFWMTEPGLDSGPPRERVAPRGPAGAALMVLVGQPEEEDRDILLAGPDGVLLARILRAMQVEESAAYVASALPRCVPLPQWDDLAARGLADLTRHHIALVAPRRLIAFGNAAAMLAAGSEVPALGAPPLQRLARSVPHKRRFWNAWLDWSA